MSVRRYTMSDIHAHTLFGIDDGSTSLKMSMELLLLAYREGIDDMVCASHSWGDMESYQKNFASLKRAIREQGLYIRIYPGSEVHCRKQDINKLIGGVNEGTIKTINRGNHLLVEFSPNAQPEDILLCSKMIRQQTGKRIVIAHIERCRNLERNMDAVEQLQNMDCLLQLNAYSLVSEKRGETKEFARKLIEQGRIAFLGSDCHRTDHRPPNVQEGLRYIHETCDEKYADAVCTQNARILLLNR